MMLSGRNEWIAIALLILYIAFVPCPYAMKEFFGTPIGKVVALGAVVYAWKYVSMPVSILLLVAFLRSGAIREYLDESGMTPQSTANNYKCPDGFMYMTEKKMCMKGDESKMPECTESGMTWNTTEGKCMASTPPTPPPTSGSGGPPGGTTPGAMAANNEMANSMPPPPATESFTPYGGKEKDFASI